MGRQRQPWAHGTAYGFSSGKCRCDLCREAFKASKRAYSAKYREMTGRGSAARAQIKDTFVPTPMQSCSCSLAGWDPPWCWTWVPWIQFHEMRQVPCAGDEYWGMPHATRQHGRRGDRYYWDDDGR
jgi:hypothetical protein